MCDPSAGLLDNLGPGRLEMGLPVGWITVLIWIEVCVRILFVDRLARSKSAIGTLPRVGQYQLCTIRSQDLLPLGRRISGQAQFDVIALGGTNHRVRNTGVAASRVEENFTRDQLATLFTPEDHIQGRPVLYRSPRIQEFRFRKNRD